MDLDEIRVEPPSNLRHEKTPVGGASSVPQDESRRLNEMSPEDLNSLKQQVWEYALEDKWKEAEPIFNKYADMVCTKLTYEQETALHVAVKANSITFVKGLVNLMTPEELEIVNFLGYTAFYMALEAGNSDLVQIMIEKNQNLALSKAAGWLPVHSAVIDGRHKMVQVLSSETLLRKMEMDDIKELFFMNIYSDMFDIATKLFEQYPACLAIATHRVGYQTALEILLRKPSKELSTEEGNNNNIAASWGEYLELLKKIWLQLIKQLGWKGVLELIGTSSFVSAITDALESGNVEVVNCLDLSNNRELSLPINSNKQNILHYAVLQRHSSFVSYLFEMWPPRLDIRQPVDKDGNNILHLAAYPSQIEKTSSTLRPTTKMRIDVKWFKYVEKSVLPYLWTQKNNMGKTPKDVFHDEHKELSEQVKDTAKGIADSGMLVAALVATVAFAAALVVPGDKTNPWFTVFMMANAAALFTSSASILSFLSNFTTSRFADSEFVIALHPSLILGPILLLISIVTMVISFAAASFLIFEHTSKWAAYAVALMGVFPILLFFIFQFNIFDKYLWSRFYHMSYAHQ